MSKPTIAQLKEANPDFFDPAWEKLFGSKMEILPTGRGGYELVVDSRFHRPVYTIDPQTRELKFRRSEPM